MTIAARMNIFFTESLSCCLELIIGLLETTVKHSTMKIRCHNPRDCFSLRTEARYSYCGSEL